MKQIIDGVLYDTEQSRKVQTLDIDILHLNINYRVKILYERPGENHYTESFFICYKGRFLGEQDHIEPISSITEFSNHIWALDPAVNTTFIEFSN